MPCATIFTGAIASPRTVGFLACRAARLANNGLIILATEYHPVADDDYVEDPTVGAMMGQEQYA